MTRVISYKCECCGAVFDDPVFVQDEFCVPGIGALLCPECGDYEITEIIEGDDDDGE